MLLPKGAFPNSNEVIQYLQKNKTKLNFVIIGYWTETEIGHFGIEEGTGAEC